MKRFASRLAMTTALAPLALTAVPAIAAETEADREKIPEIVVTADKFEKSIQDTSIAVTVVTGEQIAENGQTKIDDVLKNEPAVIVQGAARGFLVSIRGLGLSLPPQMGQGAVSTNYDGAFSSRAENASAGFYDLDRVEVLRGPQSTLYGRNSVGGVVNIISKDPSTSRVEGYVTGEVGSYSLVHGEGAVNVPLGSDAAIRVSGAGINRDGYISNGHDDNDAYAGRVKLLFEPSEALRMIVGVERSALRGKGPGAIPVASVDAGNRTTTDVAFGYQKVNAWKYWADLSADIGPGTLRIIPSLQITKGETLGAFGGNFNWAADPKNMRQEQFEARYSSAAGSPVEWNAGFYHYKSKNQMQTLAGTCEDTAGNFVVPALGHNSVPPGPPGPAAAGTCIAANVAPLGNYQNEIRTSQTDGLFGQVTIPVGETVRLIAGARYSWEKVGGANDDNADYVGPLPTLKDGHFDYRLGVEADLAEDVLFYATTASGYRQGGFGFSQVFPTYAAQPYNPEKMKSYEAGLKSRLADGAVLLNATAFYYDYQSFQLVVADFSNFPPAFSVPTMPAREYGVELETVFAIGDRGKLNGSITWLDSRLDGVGGFYVGLPFPNSPTWAIKSGFEQGLTLGGLDLTPRIDVRYSGASIVFPEAFAVPDTHPSVQKGYFTGDASVKFDLSDSLTAVAYVKNFNDKMIKQSHFFGYAQLAAPRTYGLTVSYRF